MTSTTSASTDPPNNNNNNNNNSSNNNTNNNNNNNNSNNNNSTNNNNKNNNNAKTTPRKKKAARACIHCQKAHLTCDDARPCQRCIKRGLNSTCTDGARKKAKYLQDTDESSIQPRYIPPQSNTSPSNGLQQQTNPLLASFATNTNPLDAFGAGLDTNQLLDLNNYNYGFGSTATNLEYSILSSMLGSPINQLLDSSSATTPTTPTSLSNLWQAAAAAANLTSSSTNNNSNNNSNNSTPTSSFNNPLDTTTHHIGPFSTSTPSATTTGLDTVLYSPDQNSIGSPYSGNTPTSQTTANSVRMSSLSSYGEGAVVAKVVSPNTALAQVKRRNQLVTPEMVYSRATKPYSYADGYHYLINYVRQKMSREDLMRISRALALFRPSVLASMLNLNEVDLIYTEKCLQRTLLEYEKLISYSGTPTVVWRRTGEIVLVGKEFSLLTQWSRDALLGKKTYIYELMSNSSTIEYWERYSSCAFDNSDSAVYSSCILLSPTKRSVPCTFCFTIKRDIFDLPSVIIGNFLPILS
ncbi:hypothetical protein BJ944DRAFT_175026 [Cunninghamella echinulata]|nr:hypothetical protein BJ944DRAFT_175026 [Cunninghamella echinulata]